MQVYTKGFAPQFRLDSRVVHQFNHDCSGSSKHCTTSQLPQSSPFNISLFYSDCRNHTGHPIAMSKNYFEDDNLSGGLTKYQKYFDF